MRKPKNINRTTLTLDRDDIAILLELQQKLELKLNIPKLSYIDIVRKALREQLQTI